MRTTNLIQSYISNNPASRQYSSDKAVKDFDVNKELANRTFIKPLPSNGKLIKNSIFDIPSEIRKDMLYDWNAFKHAVKGEANDHELGRLNDVGMKIGGLAIASYLFTKKQTPMNKLFEFIGLGTFFAAMDVWPKLFIQLPAYLIHGVNVRQQYEDSFGRKKMFYQDHQFIPWDLYSDKEINAIGDRLNVPKDIPNRREFIQEKMRKIALQNNTLWMLTAGFATPIMSALMCNLLESPVSKYLSKVKSQKADKLMSNFSDEIKKYKFEDNKNKLAQLLSENTGKPLTPEVYSAIKSNLTDELDYMVGNGIIKDLDNIMSPNTKFTIDTNSLDAIRKTIQKAYAPAKLSEEELTRLIPDNEAISNALSSRSLLNGSFKDADLSEHSKIIQSLLEERIANLKNENPNNPIVKKLEFALKKLIHAPEFGSNSSLFKSFKQTSATILTEDLARKLTTISDTVNTLKARKLVLEKYSFIKAAQAPETGLADSWNEIQDSIFKALKFTPEEIKKGRFDREIAGEVFRSKLEHIAADSTAYSDFINVVQKSLSSLHGQMSKLDMTQDASINQYKAHVIDSFDGAANIFRNLGMQNAVDALVGFGDNSATSAKALMFEFIEDRTLGVKSSFYRLLNMADLYHRISTRNNIDVLSDSMLREVKEECVELAKSLLMEAHTSDYAVKFWQKRNPTPQQGDFSQIETLAGKVVNKYFGKHQTTELAELPNDREYFKNVMKLMFGGEIHPDTKARLENSGFLSDFEHYRKQSFEVLGGDQYFVKPNHIVGMAPYESSSLFRFLLTGSASDEMAYKYFNQKFNSGKWFSMFGKLGAALVGVTLVSQFFFGHMKNPKKQSKEVK